MDTTKLIEEAEREIAHMKAEALSAENPYNENTIRLTLIMDLVSALKASEESLQDARAELAPRIACIGRMEEERRALQSANLAANKRIVELEHVRDAARAELASLTTPRPIAEAPRDGTNILGVWLTSSAPEVMHWDGSYWTDEGEELVYKPTHYLPLPEVHP